MMTFNLTVDDETFFRFRRWLRARDPEAMVSWEPDGDGWAVRVETTKAYLRSVSLRRWAEAA